MADEDVDEELENRLFWRDLIRGIQRQPRIVMRDNKLYEKDIKVRTRVINKFGIKAFKSLKGDHSSKNQIICPPNLFSSLLILLIGSNGDTFFELREFLDFEKLDDDTVFKTLQTVLLLASTEKYKLRPNYKLWNDIRVLIDEKVDPNDRFHILVKRYFGVDIDWIDFKKDCHLICDQINQLIQIDFEDKNVKKFYVSVNERTQLIVLSAVTFKGNWQYRFPADMIVDDIFYNYGEYEGPTKMMLSKRQDFKVVYNGSWESLIVELPMCGLSLTFLLILPKKRNGLTRLLNEFSLGGLEDCIKPDIFHPSACTVCLPPFTVEKEYDFGEHFSHLSVFSENAEMTQIAQNDKFRANNVLHKVKFEVDGEGYSEGTERELAKGANPRTIKADHPFLFIVKDVRTQTFLFIGKINYLYESSDN